MIRRTIAILAAVVAISLVAVSAAFAASPLENPGFETGDLSSWNADSSGSGSWGTTATGAGGSGTTNAPLEGSFSALWDMGGPSGAVLSQAFTVPETETLSFAFAYDNQAGVWAQDEDPYGLEWSSNQWLRIDVLESGADPGSLDADDIVATAFDSQSGEHPFSQGWENVTVPLAGRAGDTLIFRIATVNTFFFMPVWLDGVSSSTEGNEGNRAGFCSVAGNTTPNGTAIPPGTFLDLGVSEPSTVASYKGATPAYYYEGLGISCDVLPGYTKTGEMVGYGGPGDPGGYTYMAKN
jgi:hypothetical protein